MSGVLSQRTDGGEDRYLCQNCEKTWPFAKLHGMSDLDERVACGELMPAGECPKCGALVHPVKPFAEHRQRELEEELAATRARADAAESDWQAVEGTSQTAQAELATLVDKHDELKKDLAGAELLARELVKAAYAEQVRLVKLVKERLSEFPEVAEIVKQMMEEKQ